MRTRLVAAALIVTALLGACGDDDDDDGGGEALTEAEFIEQGNQICVDAEAEVDEQAEAAFTGEPTPEAIKTFFDEVIVPAANDQLAALRDLNPPDELADDVAEALDAAEDRTDEIAAMSADELFELLSSGENPYAEVDELVVAIGLTDCADDED